MSNAPRFTALTEATESLLGQIADEFHEAYQRGERPDIEALATRHPQLADVIRQVLPAMLLLPQPAEADALHTEFPGGKELGDYRIVREIGRGGMGLVFEAEQLSLGRRVALKILPFARMLDSKQLARFRNEARAAATLEHPHIVPVYAVGEERGVHYYAMRLIRGQSLADAIQAWRGERIAAEIGPGQTLAGPKSPVPRGHQRKSTDDTAVMARDVTVAGVDARNHFRRVAEIGAQIAMALDHAHREGILHRDVKPANILLDGEGKAWITDFGLARLETDASMTASGDLVGTVRYMSPEQAGGRLAIVDQRSDVYALGVTLYEAVTLRPVFDDSSREGLLHRVIHDEPAAPRSIQSQLPLDLETITLKAMRKEASDRYATAADFAQDLQRYLDDRPIHARRPSVAERLSRWSRQHRSLVRSAVVVAILALISMGIAWRAESARRQQAVLTAQNLNHQIYALKAALAQEAIEHERVSEAIDQLNSCPEALRGWEWRYLLRLTNQSRTSLHPHDYRISFVQFSPDGRLFLTAGHDGKLTVWDAHTERLIWTWRSAHVVPGWGLYCATFSPDSKTIAVGDDGGVATLLDSVTGVPLREVLVGDEQNAVRSIAFSKDGSEFVTGGGNGILAAFRTHDGQELWRNRNALPQQIYSVEYHRSGHQIATSGTPEAPINIWDAHSGRLLQTFTDTNLKHGFGDVCCVRFSPDGKSLVSAADDRTLKLWNAETGELVRTETGHSNWVRWFEFSPDGQWIATASRDSTIGIWRASTLEQLTKLRGHTEYVYCLGWSPDGESLISCSNGEDNCVKLWDVTQGASERRLAGDAALLRVYPREDSVTSLAISRAPRLLCAGHQGGALGIWNLDSEQELANLVAPDEAEVSAMAVTPNGNRVVAGKANGRIDVWEVQGDSSNAWLDARLARRVRLGIRCKVNAIELSANSDDCYAALSDGCVAAVDVNNGRERYRFAAHTGECRAIAMIPDADLFASCGDDGLVKLWNTETGEAQGVLTGRLDGPSGLGVSGDGRLLVSAHADGQINLWDMTSRTSLRTIQASMGAVRTIEFHPTELRFASAGEGGVIKLWACEAGQSVLNLRPEPDLRLCGREVLSTAFSPDGNSLAAGMEDGSIRVWDSQGADDVLMRRRFAVRVAAQRVDAFKLRSNSYAEVIASLNTDRAKSAVDQPFAVEIAAARSRRDPAIARNAAQSAEVIRILGGANPTEAELQHVLQVCDAALNNAPDDVWLMLFCGWAQFRLNKLDESLATLEHANSPSQTDEEAANPAVAAALACVYSKQGRTREASMQLERARRFSQWPVWKESPLSSMVDAFMEAAETQLETGNDSGDPE